MAFRVDYLPEKVAAVLRGFYRRKRVNALLRALFASVVLYLLLTLVALHLDRFFFLAPRTRVSLFYGVHGLSLTVLVLLIVHWIVRRPSVAEVAYELESRLPDRSGERFVTLADLLPRDAARDEVQRQLLAQLSTETVERARDVRPGRLIRDKRLRLLAAAFAVLGLIFLGLSVLPNYQFHLMVQRFVHPWRNLPKPSFVRIEVRPDHLVIGKGEEAVLQAEISGEVPPVLAWILERVGHETGRCLIDVRDGTTRFAFDTARATEMSRIQRRLFLYTRSELEETFAFRMRCGDAETRVHTVEVVPQPRVVNLALTVTPPEYTEQPVRTITDTAGPVSFLPGTEITLTFQADQPLESSKLVIDKKESVEPEWDPETRTGSYAFTLQEPVTIEVQVVNKRGFANVRRAVVAIGVREDERPVVRVSQPATDVEKVPGELVPVEAIIEDDLAVKEVSLRFRLNPTTNPDAPFQELPVELPEKAPTLINLNTSFDLGKTGAGPGDEVQLMLRARDSAGSDGTSRPTLIRIVAFTRGENERMRLVHLRFLGDAFGQIAAAEPPETFRPLEVPGDKWTEIMKRAAESEITLDDYASVDALLDLIRREHHFTDRPRDKETLRMLHGAVLSACLPLAAPASAQRRAGVMNELAKQVVPSLVRYRRLKNITWRLFGMKYEVQRIAGRFAELDAAEQAGEAQKSAIKRRSKIYLETLQNLGSELITLARTTPALDEQTVMNIQGELNTAAYYLGRGSFKRRIESCEQVGGHIRQLLALIPPALPTLLDEEHAARQRLRKLHDDTLRRIAAGAPEGVEAALWRDDCARWLGAQQELADLNPFAPLPPRITLLRLAMARAAAEAGPVQVALPERQVNMLARGAMRQASEWRDRLVRGLENVSDTEKALALRLIRLEAASQAQVVPQAKLAELTAEVRSFKTGTPVPIPSLTTLAPLVLPEGMAPVLEAERALADAVAPQLLGDPAELVARLIEQTAVTERALESLPDAIKAGENDRIRDAAARARDALKREMRLMDRAITRLSLRMRYLIPPAQVEVQNEVLCLRLQTTAARYRALPAVSEYVALLERVAAGAGLDPGALGRLNVELVLVRTARQALSASLEKTLADYRAGALAKVEPDRGFAVMEDYARTRRLVGFTREVAESADPGDVARRYLAAFQDAAVDYLTGRLPLLTRAAAHVTESEKLLRAGQFRAQAYASEVEALLDIAGQLRAAVATAGAGDLQDRLSEDLAEATPRLRALPLGETRTQVELRKRLFALGELAKSLDAMKRRLTAARETDTDAGGDFRGGPDGIWRQALRQDAERARRRLLGQVALARQRVTAGILSSLEAGASTDYADAQAWALLVYRTTRSPLNGPGGMRTQQRKRDEKGDRFVQWLLKELDESRKAARKAGGQGAYTAITREFLDSMADFLRY